MAPILTKYNDQLPIPKIIRPKDKKYLSIVL